MLMRMAMRVRGMIAPRDEKEDGFEIAQAMGIALLGLVVTAAFAAALEAVGVDVITSIRGELGL